MANPSRDRYEPVQPNHASSSFNGHANGNSFPAAENSGPVLQHNPGFSMDWTPEEQSILDEGLAKYASQSNISRYAKIATQLQNKTVRDVALRCRWITKKENSRRRKEDNNLTKKSKDKKEKGNDPSAISSRLATRPGFSPYAQGMVSDNTYDDLLKIKNLSMSWLSMETRGEVLRDSEAIDGATGQLLQQNAQVLQHISLNLDSHQIHENAGLFCQARDNILKILNNLKDMPDTMKRMPPLPVMMDEELANSILNGS